ncbi:MAG: FAD-dependent oxidoreductase [Alphaproteobacteria bacterium]|nr:FAD-dependent oxidoreductase [Alphaproteobacteria bacterium]
MAEIVPLLVMGAGPAGLAAADTALAHGMEVMLLDEQPGPGGQIYRNIADADEGQRRILGPDYAHGTSLLAVLERGGLDYRPGAMVWEVTPDRTVYFTQDARARAVTADRIILAPGAMERPMPFPGWTLPGVMTCGAAQIMLKAGGIVAEGAVLAGSGPLLLLIATQMLAAGARIEAIVETTPTRNYLAALRHLPRALRAADYLRKGIAMTATLRRAGIPWYKGARGLQAIGADRVEALRFTAGGKPHELACKTLLLHQGVVPNVQISRSLRLDHDWDAMQRAWRPRLNVWGETALPGIFVAGDGGGIVGAKASAIQGRLAGLRAIDAPAGEAAPLRRALSRELAIRPFLDRLYRPAWEFLAPADGTIVCRCEEVLAGQIRDHVRIGCLGPNQAKAYSRAGMGPCQGRLCGLTVSEIIAEARGVSPGKVGYYRIRTPIKPVTLGELASLAEED